MRVITRALTVVGLLLLVLAGAWKWAAPGQLLKYPLNVDRTFAQTGEVDSFVAPGTMNPAATPAKLPLAVKVRMHVVGHSGNNVIVEEVQDQNIGNGAVKARQTSRFVFNRNTIKNVTSDKAYAFGPANPVDRSPNYAVNFPTHSGDGPYAVWKDETGTTFPMSKLGDAQPVHGVKLATMRGTMSGTPLADYYLATLPGMVAKQQPLASLGPALASTHIDPVAIISTVKNSLTAADYRTVFGLLTKTAPLKFQLAATTTMTIEPTTGVIVGLDVDQTLSALPDVTSVAKIQAILSQPRYSGMANVGLAQGLMAKLAANPPANKVIRIKYSSTPDAVAGLTDYANNLRKKMVLVERTVPLVLLGAGLVLFVMGLLGRFLGAGGRRDDDASTDDGPGGRPATAAAARRSTGAPVTASYPPQGYSPSPGSQRPAPTAQPTAQPVAPPAGYGPANGQLGGYPSPSYTRPARYAAPPPYTMPPRQAGPAAQPYPSGQAGPGAQPYPPDQGGSAFPPGSEASGAQPYLPSQGTPGGEPPVELPQANGQPPQRYVDPPAPTSPGPLAPGNRGRRPGARDSTTSGDISNYGV